MNFLEEKILKDGLVVNSNILKVDSFINHQVDSSLMRNIGLQFASYFRDKGITKVVTIEASGIAPALMTAFELNVPMVIFKKQSSKILTDNVYHTEVTSFTKGNTYDLIVSKKYLNNTDNILIVDDFLANGDAAFGAIRLIQNTEAKISGIGVIIEKSFQPRSKKINKSWI